MEQIVFPGLPVVVLANVFRSPLLILPLPPLAPRSPTMTRDRSFKWSVDFILSLRLTISTVNQRVAGSSPAGGAISFNDLAGKLADIKFPLADNPAVVLVGDSAESMLLGLLPLCPEKLLVIYDREKIKFKQTRLSDDDVSLVNGLQAANSFQAVYSRDELTVDELSRLGELFGRRLQPIRVRTEGISYRLRPLTAAGGRFSFVTGIRS